MEVPDKFRDVTPSSRHIRENSRDIRGRSRLVQNKYSGVQKRIEIADKKALRSTQNFKTSKTFERFFEKTSYSKQRNI